jgi:NADH dehydrogenase
MRVFVAGGTGFVGSRLCRELGERGHEIRLLVHRKQDGPAPGGEQVPGDVTRLESFSDAVAGCDAIINLVGIIREFPGKGVTFEKLHVEATRTMLAAAEQAGVSRYLQMSALGTRPNAVALYHRTKWRAEELVRASRLEWTIFRPSLIYGPGDAFVNMLAGFIRDYPAVPVIGDGKYRLQPIAVADVARCFAQALEMPQTITQTYELCGSDRFSYVDMLDIIGRVLGKPSVTKLKNPLGLMKLVTPFLQQFPFFPLTMDQIQMLTEENICSSSWPTVFGFEPERFEHGIAAYLSGK